MTAQTLATTEIKVTPDPGPVFPKFLTPSLDPGPKEKRRTLAESTPVNRILSHLWIPANSAARANHTKSAKHMVDSHLFFQTRTHLH